MNEELAIIDLGTNSVRFEIYKLSGSGPVLLHRERYMPRLGAGLQSLGQLGEEAEERTLSVFKMIHAELTRRAPLLVAAVGTSALREASNAAEFLDRVEHEFGIRVQVISGKEEAELTAAGIISHERTLPEEAVLADIGGGSTELSGIHAGNVVFSVSVPLGAIRCRADFLSEHSAMKAAPSEALERLRRHIEKLLQEILPKDFKAPLIIGSSGTIRSLCGVEGGDGSRSRQYIRELVSRLAVMTTEEIAAIQDLERNRADIILPGAVIFQALMEHFDAAEVRASKFSLRHGVLTRSIAELASAPGDESNWSLLRRFG